MPKCLFFVITTAVITVLCTFLAFGPDRNLPQLMRWLDILERQPALEAGL